jgi:hypothetical protein
MPGDVFEKHRKMQQVGKNEKIVLVKLTKFAPQFSIRICVRMCADVVQDATSFR